MPFHPSPNAQLSIRNKIFTICEHPVLPGWVHGQMGRRATVYRVKNPNGEQFALKVFTSAFRTSQTETGAQRIRSFATLPGLQVCARLVLTRSSDTDLLTQHPDLEYAVLMPWVAGKTWQEIMLDHQPLTPEQSLALAHGLASVLATMEQKQIAHCDLSGPNVLVELSTSNHGSVALVDVEDLYSPGLEQPAKLPGGSAGYGHRTATGGLWCAEADRFAGAILIAEMLGWCDERIRRIAFGEQFFEPGELQKDNDRYQLLSQSLKEKWGEATVGLLSRAWNSQTLFDCPTLVEWLALLSARQQQVSIAQELAAAPSAEGPVVRWRTIGAETASQPASLTAVAALIKTADDLVAQGNLAGALGVLRQAKEMASPAEVNEINEKIVKVYEKQNFTAPSPAQPTEPKPQRIAHPQKIPARQSFKAADDRPKNVEKRWLLGLLGFFIFGLIIIGVLGFMLQPPQSTPEAPTLTRQIQIIYPTETTAPPTSPAQRAPTSLPSTPRKVSTPTRVKQATSGLQSCVTSAGEVCVYSLAPQDNGLVVALKFKQELSTGNLPTLTVAGKKFKCEILSTYPDRLYCSGPVVTGNSELLIYSSSGQLLASGTVNIPKYIPPSPTRRKSGGTYL